MKWFYNLKVAKKLLLGFISVAIIAGVVGVVGIVNIKTIEEADTAMYMENSVPLSELAVVMEKYHRSRVNIRELAINTDDTSVNESISTIKQYSQDIQDNLDKFKTSISSDVVLEEFNILNNLFDQKFDPYVEKIFSMSNSGQTDQINNVANTEGKQINQEIQTSIDKLFALKVNLAKEKSDDNTSTANTAVTTMIIIVVVGMAVAIGLGFFISQIISKPVRKMVEAADKLAVGDVGVSVMATTKDEIGNLMQSFSKMIENVREQAFAVEKIASGDLTIDVKVKSENDLLGKKLGEMIEINNETLSNINSASSQVAAGAKQVSVSSQALSQGSTEQASSIEEITSSITEVSTQTKKNAENANQANQLALAAKENAAEGNRQMQEMVKAMTEINDSSANISKIIKVIDEIAFQTNILALNAAVEAARAGQHGKGFAVVAEEVRNLAARSANAAKETTEMIESSIKKVEVGTKIANDTAGALTKIVDGVTKAADLVGDIAAASNEQATGISQINQAISQVAQVVQTNSATAEESASASEELSSQADLLRESVNRFKLKKIRSSNNLEHMLSSDVIRMIEDAVEKKKPHNNNNLSTPREETTNSIQPASSKAVISLEEKDFGKY